MGRGDRTAGGRVTKGQKDRRTGRSPCSNVPLCPRPSVPVSQPFLVPKCPYSRKSHLSFLLRVALCGMLLYLSASSIEYPASSIQRPESRTQYLIERANRAISLSRQDWLAPQREQADQESPQVGDQKKFYAVDFARSGVPYLTSATCRAVGKFCYIFVEDKQWDSGVVTHTGVVKLKRAFDESTPADPARGIYKLETEDLGPAPDEIDQDPKIYILILDIPDAYNGFGDFIAGYFEPINQKRGVFRDPNTGMKLYSNEVEMIYLDANPLEAGSTMSMEILAHEFQHVIHWRHDPNEEVWLNEGCSDYAAMFLCGYNTDQDWHTKAFEEEPQTSLVYWPGGMASSLANYGAAYLFMVYLHEHYGGVSTISALIAYPADGISGVNAVLSARGYSEDFGDVFSDWKIANYLDDTGFDSGKYGYMEIDLSIKRGRKHFSFPVSSTSRYIQSWAGDYIEFTGGDRVSDLQIDFIKSNPDHNFDVRAIVMAGGEPVAVESVLSDGHVSISDFGDAVDTVVLVSSWQPGMKADFGKSVSYSYLARLGEEISFDVTLLANAVHKRYVDIVVRLDEDSSASVPRITITRLGETIVNDQKMLSLSEAVYAYQLYIPYGWDGSEVRWDISYFGRSVERGDLGTLHMEGGN